MAFTNLTLSFFLFQKIPLPCPDAPHEERLTFDILEDRGWVNEKLEETEVLKIESVIFLGKIDVF